MKRNKVLLSLLLTLLFIGMNATVYYLTKFYSKNKIDMVLGQDLETLQTHYNILLQTQKISALATYKSTIGMDRVIEIMIEASDARKRKKSQLREELHNLLNDKYQILKEKGVLQYQFVLANNESFYRAHKPSKFGDDLTNIREDFKYVNKIKEPIQGFTQGKTAHGFRNTFPMTDEQGNHIGAMEVSFSSDRLEWFLNTISGVNTHFLVKKSIFEAKSWNREDMVLKYITSSENENYMITLTGIHTKEKCVNQNGIKLRPIKKEIARKIEEKQPFTSFVEYKNKIVMIAFVPIKNIKKQTVAWIVSYAKSPIIKTTLLHMLILRIIAFLTSLLIIYFLYKQISSRKKIEEQKEYAQKQHQLLNEILSTTENIMIITDFKNIKFSNDKFKSLLHVKSTNTINQRNEHNMLNLFIEVDTYLHQGLLEKNENFASLVARTSPEDRIVSITDQYFEAKAFKISVSKLEDNDDYLISLTDITKLKEELLETEKKAYIDGLTQVYNRNKFDALFEEELKRVKRYHEPLSVALLDIDKFKNFNDTYGHLIGDEVLIIMAQTVNKAVRETDIFARWGGEEFVILFKNTTLDRAKEVSEKLKNKIEENEHETAGKITASFGVTEYQKEDTIESIFKRCDEALYIAKENGRNRVEVL